MNTETVEHDRLVCAPMGSLEYVVECRQHGRSEKWFIVRPQRESASASPDEGASSARGCRIVVDAHSLRTIGVLAHDVCPPTRSPHGHNPYFDLPPA